MLVGIHPPTSLSSSFLWVFFLFGGHFGNQGTPHGHPKPPLWSLRALRQGCDASNPRHPLLGSDGGLCPHVGLWRHGDSFFFSRQPCSCRPRVLLLIAWPHGWFIRTSLHARESPFFEFAGHGVASRSSSSAQCQWTAVVAAGLSVRSDSCLLLQGE